MAIILADITLPYTTADLFKQMGIKPLPMDTSATLPKKLTSTTGSIIEGNRNTKLTSIAGTMRNKGMEEEAIAAALLTMNQSQIQPPLPESEVLGIVTSIMRYPTSDQAKDVMLSLNDVGNTKRFSEKNRDTLRYALGIGNWLQWSDERWLVDNNNIHVMNAAKIVVKDIFTEAAHQTDASVMKLVSQHANKSNNLPRIKAMIEIAASDPELCVPIDVLDSNPLLLGVANGVVDLTSGKLISNIQELLITRYSGVFYDKTAQCPVFIEFLDKIFNADKDKIAFIQRIFGYCLTGSTNEQVYFFFFGFGANGKSTLLNVIEQLLGSDLAKQTPAETLMAKLQGGKQSNDLARLNRVRTVIANEIEDGSHLAESLVKQITGGDTVTARYLFKEYFEYKPEFKLIIAGNHKPIIKSSDNGIWRRTVLVHFPVSIPKDEQDAYLSKKLSDELSGILNWAIKGCLEWQKIGLAIPASVEKDVTDYKEEMDWLGLWIADCCKIGVTESEKADSLYQSYKYWAEVNGIFVPTSTTFGRRLTERGFEKTKRTYARYYIGLSVISYR
jgi:putative DNA primase/helicase